MKLTYKLTKEQIIDYQFAMAYRNKKLHQTNIKLLISFSLIILILGIFVFETNWVTISVMSVILLMILLFFPKYYWKRIEKKIKETIEKKNLEFSEVNVELSDKLEAVYLSGKITAKLDQIKDVIFTKNLCILQVEINNKTEAIIIPLDSIENMEEFVRKVRSFDNEKN